MTRTTSLTRCEQMNRVTEGWLHSNWVPADVRATWHGSWPVMTMQSICWLPHHPQVVRSLKRLIDDPTFQPDQVAKQSKAAMSMCLWVRAMDTYAKMAKVTCSMPQRMLTMG